MSSAIYGLFIALPTAIRGITMMIILLVLMMQIVPAGLAYVMPRTALDGPWGVVLAIAITTAPFLIPLPLPIRAARIVHPGGEFVFGDAPFRTEIFDRLRPREDQPPVDPMLERRCERVPGEVERYLLFPRTDAGKTLGDIIVTVRKTNRPEGFSTLGEYPKPKFGFRLKIAQVWRFEELPDGAVRVALTQKANFNIYATIIIYLSGAVPDWLEATLDWMMGRPALTNYGRMVDARIERSARAAQRQDA